MNNEIIEKIYKLRAYLGTEENWLLNDIADYITNLQQENQKLKNRIEEITKIYQNESKYRTDLEAKYVQLQQENQKNKKS